MCLIIDADLAAAIFRPSPDEDFRPLLRWLLSHDKTGILVTGGLNRDQLARVDAAFRAMATLSKAGRLHLVADQAVAAEVRVVRVMRIRSNDEHVIALARVSRARTLCTGDGDLQKDFKDCRLINDPRGSVYRTAEHEHLLRHTKGCPGRQRGLR